MPVGERKRYTYIIRKRVMMRRILWVILMVFSLSSTAWGKEGLFVPPGADSHEKLPQTKTQWQHMAEMDIDSKNDRWGLIQNQFQPGNPPSESK